jgi:hypothetical protein
MRFASRLRRLVWSGRSFSLTCRVHCSGGKRSESDFAGIIFEHVATARLMYRGLFPNKSRTHDELEDKSVVATLYGFFVGILERNPGLRISSAVPCSREITKLYFPRRAHVSSSCRTSAGWAIIVPNDSSEIELNRSDWGITEKKTQAVYKDGVLRP